MIAVMDREPPQWKGPALAIVASLGVLLLCAMMFGDDVRTKAPQSVAEWPERPAAGLTVPGQVVEVYDGDTMTVEVRWRVRVRLLDCWAPEVRSLDAGEKRRGQAAKAWLQGIANNKACTLWIPAHEIKTLGDLTSMGRVLGHVWIGGDNSPVSRHMVDAGHATRAKQTRAKEASGD